MTPHQDQGIIGIIPARGGSKGIPQKNIKPLCGKPLILYTIEEAQQSKLLSKIFVSTEDPEIKQIALKAGVEVIDRPAEFAQDNSPTLPVLQHAVETLEKRNEKVSIVVLLQPTALFKRAEEIDEAIEKFLNNNADSLISLSPTPKHFHPLWQKKLVADLVHNLDELSIDDDQRTVRRQDIPQTYWKNGQLYIMKRDTLMKKQSLFGDRCLSFIIHRKDIVNIDAPEDFAYAAYLLNTPNTTKSITKNELEESPMRTIQELTQKVFIVAEIGKNFIQTEEPRPIQEYLENAKKLVDAAQEAGASAVKFQTHEIEDEQLNIEVTAPHFKGSDRYNWVKRNHDATPLATFWKPLKEYCDKKGILFMSTPMSKGAAQKLQQLGVEVWKVGSGDILDFVMLDYISSTKKPIIISSGMSSLEETDSAVEYLKKKGADFAVLHCVSEYPCPLKDLNLATIAVLQKRYHLPVGFSDHSLSIDPAVGAVVLGAKIVERHFTFDRDLWGPDHKVGLTPSEFKELVQKIRAVEADTQKGEIYLQKPEVRLSMGTGIKKIEEGEAVYRGYFKKALVASCNIQEGEIITKEMMYAMRPKAFTDGIGSERYEDVLGKKTNKLVARYDPISPEDLVGFRE